jgi:hypothetical protein
MSLEAVAAVTIIIFPLHTFGDAAQLLDRAGVLLRALQPDGPVEDIELQFLAGLRSTAARILLGMTILNSGETSTVSISARCPEFIANGNWPVDRSCFIIRVQPPGATAKCRPWYCGRRTVQSLFASGAIFQAGEPHETSGQHRSFVFGTRFTNRLVRAKPSDRSRP